MSGLRALLYADARSIVNQLRAIGRHPGRSAIWFVWLLLLGVLLTLRLLRGGHHHGVASMSFQRIAQADLLACSGVILFGAMLVSGSVMTGLFAHVAEARFIIGAPISPIVATLYVQARELLRRGARLLLTLGYLIVVYLPQDIGAAALARDILYVILGLAAIAAIPLPRRLLHGAAAAAAVAAGWACIAFGALPLARDAAVWLHLPAPFGPALRQLPSLHPGLVLLERAGPHAAFVLAVLLLVTAAAFLALARTARDAYPEIYTLSLDRIAHAERRRKRRTLGTNPTTARARAPLVVRQPTDAAHVPGGAGVFLWRAWTEYRRKNSPRSSAIETAVCLIAGYAAARFAGTNASLLASAGIAAANVLLLFSLGSATRLGAELRRPLFHLSPATLFERLCGLIIGETWRIGAWLLLLAVGLAAGHAVPGAVLAAAFVAPASIVLASAVGYVLFALMPHDIDQRGPLALVRWFLTYLFVAPAIAAGVVAGIALDAAPAGLAAAGFAALVEAGALIGIAAWRLDRARSRDRRVRA